MSTQTKQVQCRNCGHTTDVDTTICKCQNCKQVVCLTCGCTNTSACFTGLDEGSCYWVQKGQCSACTPEPVTDPAAGATFAAAAGHHHGAFGSRGGAI